MIEKQTTTLELNELIEKLREAKRDVTTGRLAEAYEKVDKVEEAMRAFVKADGMARRAKTEHDALGENGKVIEVTGRVHEGGQWDVTVWVSPTPMPVMMMGTFLGYVVSVVKKMMRSREALATSSEEILALWLGFTEGLYLQGGDDGSVHIANPLRE